MEEIQKAEKEISLFDILRLLLSKIKILILVVVVGALLGGGLAYWKNSDIHYYGRTVEFYINPEKASDGTSSGEQSQYGVYGAYGKHVMDNMVKLLSSQSFGEILMADMSDAPQKQDDVMTNEYAAYLSKVVNSVTFSYLQNNENINDANNLARSFIYVKINVLNDKAFAEELLERIKKEVPAYVEANMAVPSDFQSTNCQQITVIDEIQLLNPGFAKNQALKYGALVAAIALIGTCVIIIFVDKSDKRLRDYDVISKKLHIPVLGIIPSIEDILPDGKPKRHGGYGGYYSPASPAHTEAQR